MRPHEQYQKTYQLSGANGLCYPVDCEYLSKFFHLDMREAARLLGICVSQLKKACRKLGVARWPSRKIRAVRRLLDGHQSLGNLGDSNVVNQLERAHSELLKDPQMEYKELIPTSRKLLEQLRQHVPRQDTLGNTTDIVVTSKIKAPFGGASVSDKSTRIQPNESVRTFVNRPRLRTTEQILYIRQVDRLVETGNLTKETLSRIIPMQTFPKLII